MQVVFGVSISILQASKYVAHKMGAVHADEPGHYSLRDLKQKEMERWQHTHIRAKIHKLPDHMRDQSEEPPPPKEVGWRRIR